MGCGILHVIDAVLEKLFRISRIRRPTWELTVDGLATVQWPADWL